VLQAARLTGQSMSPQDVRSLLESTGRQVATPPQIDQSLHVGRQIDITAAVSAVLGNAHQQPQGGSSTSIVRLSVAHRQEFGALGGEFIEYTDPNMISLTDQSYQSNGVVQTLEGLNGPVTIGADVTGLPNGTKPDYVLSIGGHEFHSQVPAIRLTPEQMLAAAGFPLASTTNRTIQLTFEVRTAEGRVLASAHQPLTFGPTDGTYLEALAPVAPATVHQGAWRRHRPGVQRVHPDPGQRRDTGTAPGGTHPGGRGERPVRAPPGDSGDRARIQSELQRARRSRRGRRHLRRLPSSSGTVALNAVKLGLSVSEHYNIRVFSTDRNGTVIGQASPTSMLIFDSGLAPGGGEVASFAIQPGGTSAVSVYDPTTGGESLLAYNASTGAYGGTFATDPSTTYQTGTTSRAQRLTRRRCRPTTRSP
jgi:hypothetical protein